MIVMGTTAFLALAISLYTTMKVIKSRKMIKKNKIKPILRPGDIALQKILPDVV